MEGFSADVYLDMTDVFDDYLKLLKTHALMRDSYSDFRYYETLRPMRGALSGFGKAVTLMRPRGLQFFARRKGTLD